MYKIIIILYVILKVINKKIDDFLYNFPILKFYQSEMNYNFTLNATDLFTIIPDDNRILFNIEFLDNYNKWVFDKPFFKKYPLIFNDDSKTINYYVKQDIKYDLNYIVYINSIKAIIFCLLIISPFVIYFIINKKAKKYIREKKSLELSEYINYSNKEL